MLILLSHRFAPMNCHSQLSALQPLSSQTLPDEGGDTNAVSSVHGGSAGVSPLL